MSRHRQSILLLSIHHHVSHPSNRLQNNCHHVNHLSMTNHGLSWMVCNCFWMDCCMKNLSCFWKSCCKMNLDVRKSCFLSWKNCCMSWDGRNLKKSLMGYCMNVKNLRKNLMDGSHCKKEFVLKKNLVSSYCCMIRMDGRFGKLKYLVLKS